MQSNTAELWDELYTRETLEEQTYWLQKEELSVRWRRIERAILDRFQTFQGLRTVEVGAGMATASTLAARRGAVPTILDYAPRALEMSRQSLLARGIQAEYIQADALKLPAELLGRFDVSMSFGLTEHFSGDNRFEINKVHLDLLKPGGLAFIAVPNAWNPPYRLRKLIEEKMGTWKVGEEYPYTRGELAAVARKMGAHRHTVFGDSFFDSFDLMLNPARFVRKALGRRKPRSRASVKPQRGSFLDAYFSYALVLCATKA